MSDVYINSFGSFLPGPPIPNQEIEDYIGQINGKPSRNRVFVLRQNRIKTRHYALDKNGQALYRNAEMAAKAIFDAVERSEITKDDITYLASTTTIGDFLVPGIASHVHAELKIPPIEIASFQSVCAGSLMAIKSAFLQVKAGEHKCAAVSGSEFASRFFKPGFYENSLTDDDSTIPMDADFLRFTLSDGAGAAILENKPNARAQSFRIDWIDIRSYADRFQTSMMAGARQDDDQLQFWGNCQSLSEADKSGTMIIKQNFDLMLEMIPVWVSHYLDLITQGKVVMDEIDHVCCHYSSQSLRDKTFDLLKKADAMIDEEKWYSNLSTCGNTGSASIFILLAGLCATRNLTPGEKILCHVPESGRCVNGFMLLEVV